MPLPISAASHSKAILLRHQEQMRPNTSSTRSDWLHVGAHGLDLSRHVGFRNTVLWVISPVVTRRMAHGASPRRLPSGNQGRPSPWMAALLHDHVPIVLNVVGQAVCGYRSKAGSLEVLTRLLFTPHGA
jgi:hypothetical protein